MQRRTTLTTTALLAASMLLLTLSSPGYSCVGRILNLTVNDSPEQQLVAQILKTYIAERTGTTVEITTGTEADSAQCPTDICIFYLNSGLSGMSSDTDTQGGDDVENYSLVKEYYIENESIVWLKPFGYKGPVQQEDASLAVPVANRESLVKFPILDRVINKLGDVIDDDSLQQLLQQTESGDPATVAKDFLKAKNLI
jgi:glycine betaine/choline ABC-type transport system substrate-binding protein